MKRECIEITLLADAEAQNEKGEPQILPKTDELSGPGVTELLHAIGIEDSRNSEEDSGASLDLTGSPSEPVISDGESEEL